MLDYSANPEHAEALQRAFAENERVVRIQNYRTACVLAAVFMPAGAALDWWVYHDKWDHFLGVRLICSALLLFIWWLVKTPFGQKHYQALGLTLPALPTLCISWMIYDTAGPESPYYAGLNLVLLGAGLVLRWTLRDSIMVFFQTVVFYLGACLLYWGKIEPNATIEGALVFNNSYFLFVSGTFVVVGIYFYNRLRFKEFALRFELDLNQKELQASNQALGQKKEELEGSNQQLSQKTGQLESTLIELRQTQEQLVTKEKQASLGVWSAGIIHEMNNPLNFARTGIYALRNKDKLLPEGERAEFKEIMADVEDGINRVHTIVSDLRTYAHPSMDERDEVSAEEIVRVALRFFSGDLQDGFEVVQKIPADQMIFANRNKLIQVLGNLLQNSVDALKTKQFEQGHPTITIEGRVEEGRSRLILRDNGTGIEQKYLDKIFDPFFTTKEVGKGMGLGLGICYRIVHEFGGTISVRSEPGGFCEFTLDFPEERPAENLSDEEG